MAPDSGPETPQQFGRLTLGSFGWVTLQAELAASLYGVVFWSLESSAGARTFLLATAIWSALWLPWNVWRQTEVTLTSESLRIRNWGRVLLRRSPVESWLTPRNRWVGRKIDGGWVSGLNRKAIVMSIREHERLRASCEQQGIPIKDLMRAHREAHPRSTAVSLGLGIAGLGLMLASGLLLIVGSVLGRAPIVVALVGWALVYNARAGLVAPAARVWRTGSTTPR